MPTNTPKRLTDKAKPWVVNALNADASIHKEPVIWDLAVTVFPDISATESPIMDSSADPSAVVPLPALALYLEIPGVTPEAPLYTSTTIAPFGLTKETVTDAVDRTLASMREFRKTIQADVDKSKTEAENHARN